MTKISDIRGAIERILNEEESSFKLNLNEDKNLFSSYIRHCIYETKLKNKSNLQKEQIIRSYIKSLLMEAEAVGGSPEAPAEITAINFLKNLLKNIIPTNEEGYKELTSSKTQRVSFRRHILNATDNLLKTLDADPDSMAAMGIAALAETDDDLAVSVNPTGNPEGFIDIYGDAKPNGEAEELDPEQEFARGLEDKNLDNTGRNAAFEVFKKVQNQIENEYSKLDPDAVVDGMEETEREIFKDYLLLNLKLYFDKFEEELGTNPEEPTTPSEDEFNRTNAEDASRQDLIPPEEAGS
tara:strand:+ start:12731 stop:13618 length:888 start_codon:yes stop_codon:yes gene_type:complete